jgi:serine/threonine/tyrosine-interacting protein
MIPPPAISGGGLVDLNFDFRNALVTHADYLKTISYDNFLQGDAMISWKYEQRRTAQMILPFLYLGPSSAARDLNFLQHQGITMVMAVRDTMSAQARLLGSKTATQAGIKSYAVDVAGNQELIAAFPRAIESINAHLSTVYDEQQKVTVERQALGQEPLPPVHGKVLLYCESGNERSAAVAIAYIMTIFKLSLVQSIHIVQAQRFSISCDDDLRYLLQSYEGILLAQRDVAKSNSTASVSGPVVYELETANSHGRGGTKAAKRTIDDAYNGDNDEDMVDVDGQDDRERFTTRKGSAPFGDVFP